MQMSRASNNLSYTLLLKKRDMAFPVEISRVLWVEQVFWLISKGNKLDWLCTCRVLTVNI